MKRKIFVIAIAFFAMCSVIYAQKKDLIASSYYNVGGSVTGRVNQKGYGISATLGNGFVIGDRILMGMKNPNNSNPLAWQLITQMSYTDYGCTSTTACPAQPEVTAWHALTTESVGETIPYPDNNNWIPVQNTKNFSYSNTYNNHLVPLNSALKNAEKDYRIVAPRNLEGEHIEVARGPHYMQNIVKASAFSTPDLLGRNFFILDVYTACGVGSVPIDPNEIEMRLPVEAVGFSSTYQFSSSYNVVGTSDENLVYISDGSQTPNNATTISYSIRPSTMLDLSKIVFSISMNGNSRTFSSVTEPYLPVDYVYLHSEAKGDPMKVRLYSSMLTANLLDIYKAETDTESINKITRDDEVFIKANANAGTNADGVNTVSVLVFQHNEITGNDDFKYYKPLAPAKGEGFYTFDTSGIPLGKYKIGIVNEDYNEGSSAPADSSLISDIKELEIISPISNLAFTPTSNLIYNQNVSIGNTVGTIASSNGIGTPVYKLVPDPDHSTDVNNFELGSDGKAVQVKGDSLDAGTYYFKVQAQDFNGNPVVPLEVSALVTVARASSSIDFDEATPTKISMTQAQTPWSEIATSTPGNDELKITYSKNSGDIGIASLNPDTGEVKASSANAKGKVVIQATVDDDPTTGKDNYESSTTTKEIMIYQEVNGMVTPDSASSDVNIPTFSAMDENVRIGGKIGVVSGCEGTPDNGVSGTTAYSYGLKNDGDSSYFNVNQTTGDITSKVNLSVETYTITIIVSDNWSTKEIPVTIRVGQASAEILKFYDTINPAIIITTQNANLNETGVSVFAEVKGSSNTNAVSYGIKSGASSSVLDVHQSSGVITIKSVGTTTITATKQGEVGQAEAYAELIFTVIEGDQNFIYTDNAGNELPKNEDGSYQSYKESGKDAVYQKFKTFQLYTRGSSTGAIITYQLKSGSPSDVLQVDKDGLVRVLNASLPIQTDKIIVEAMSIDPNGDYADKTIEIPINIAKADATINFNGVSNVVSGTGSVDPLIIDQDLSSNEGGVNITDTQYIISVDPSISTDIAWTNDGITICYDFTEESGIDIPLKVIKPANRNYNKAEATGTLHILSPTENILEVSTPGKIIYGDIFTIRSLQDDTSSANVSYTFTSKDQSYVRENTQTGNQMKFDAIKASGDNEVEVDIERTADSELTLRKTIKMKVLPKDITVKVDDKEKIYGEINPVFTNQDFTSQLESWNGVRDSIQTNDVKLTSNANQTSVSGRYDINVDLLHLNKTYPNYNFKSTKGILTISEEQIQDSWYHVETEDTNSYTGNWTNQNVKIISDHDDYDQISTNKQDWQNEIIVNTEGKMKYTFYMKKMSGAISSSKETTIQIDKKPPKIASIKGIQKSNSRLNELLNDMTFNTFFKSGVSVEIIGEDGKIQPNMEVSGIKSITYKLYKKDDPIPVKTDTSITSKNMSFTIEDTGSYKVCATAIDNASNPSDEVCEEIEVEKINVDEDKDGNNDLLDPDGDGCPDLNIVWKNSDNTWIKMNVDLDKDGIPDMNIDSEGDGVADLNIDTDKDGKPDLNLVVLAKEDWKPTICVTTQPDEYCTGTSVKPQINVDTGKDGKPDINIDTSGDMKADINITRANENKPFMNMASKKSTWKPEKDYKYLHFQYDTEEDIKPLLNVDSDKDGRPDLNIDFNDDGKPDINIDANGDGIPETDIDSTGDGKSDVNIDHEKDGEPDENIMDITSWKPDKDSDKDGFLYDTMGEVSGKEQLKDNDVIVEKPGGVFLLKFSLKVDRITEEANELVKKDITLKANGQVIKEIYNVKLMEDDVQIQPDGKLRIKLPIPKGIINPKLVIIQADGTYFKIDPEIKDGYLIYESDYLGLVSIIGDHEPTVIPDTGGAIKEDTRVKEYYAPSSNTTGSNTGDTSNLYGYGIIALIGIIVVIALKKYYQKDTK